MRRTSGSNRDQNIPESVRERLLPAFSHLTTEAFAAIPTAMVDSYWPALGIRSPVFAARFSDLQQMLESAEMTVQGRIKFRHPWHMERTNEPEKIGQPIRWSRAPNGDAEWPHALVRFSHMVDLSAAFMQSGNKDFLNTYCVHLESYLQARRWDDALWKNRLSASLRLTNLVRSFDLLKNSPEVPFQLRCNVLSAILLDGDYLVKELGKHVGNWEFFICTSLITASHFLSNSFAVSEWKAAASTRLEEVLLTEIAADGIFSEQVPMYQGEVVLALLDGIQSYQANGIKPPPSQLEAAAKLLKSLVELADPEGMIPPIGDSDRFPVAYLQTFADRVFQKTRQPELASEGVTQVSFFKETGWSVVRWKLSSKSIGWLLFDASGKPKVRRRFHSHADDLQFLLHTTKGPIFTDPGRYTYAASFPGTLPFKNQPIPIYPRGRLRLLHNLLFPRLKTKNQRDWRAYFRGSASHNTVSRAGLDHPGYRPQDLGKEDSRKVTFELPIRHGPMFIFSGEASGSGGLSAEDFRHTRTVLGVLPSLVLFVDEIHSETVSDWWINFHLGPEVNARLRENGASLGGIGDGMDLHFLCEGAQKWDLVYLDDWTSPEYNTKLPTKTIRARVFGVANFRLVTALWMPTEKIVPSLSPDISSLETLGKNGAVRFHRESSGESFETVVNLRAAQYVTHGIASNAVLAFSIWTGCGTDRVLTSSVCLESSEYHTF